MKIQSGSQTFDKMGLTGLKWALKLGSNKLKTTQISLGVDQKVSYILSIAPGTGHEDLEKVLGTC
jgi:hypothetical protein